MLLLILFAGCLASSAAQSTISTNFFVAPNIETPPPSAPPAPANVMAILQAAVTSYRELNETTMTPVLMQLHQMIQQFQPDVPFTLSIKNITRV